MKISVSQAIGPVLDWMVAAALEFEYGENRAVKICRTGDAMPAWIERESIAESGYYHRFDPSTNWSLGGPIMDREKIATSTREYTDEVVAVKHSSYGNLPLCREHGPLSLRTMVTAGPTALIAISRCYVVSVLDREVEVPDELVAEHAMAQMQEEGASRSESPGY